jgi:hypothetical protein
MMYVARPRLRLDYGVGRRVTVTMAGGPKTEGGNGRRSGSIVLHGLARGSLSKYSRSVKLVGNLKFTIETRHKTCFFALLIKSNDYLGRYVYVD